MGYAAVVPSCFLYWYDCTCTTRHNTWKLSLWSYKYVSSLIKSIVNEIFNSSNILYLKAVKCEQAGRRFSFSLSLATTIYKGRRRIRVSCTHIYPTAYQIEKPETPKFLICLACWDVLRKSWALTFFRNLYQLVYTCILPKQKYDCVLGWYVMCCSPTTHFSNFTYKDQNTLKIKVI